MNIRTYLKKTREEASLTQLEVAKHLSIAVTSYQRIELGTRGTSEENWLKLYNLFNKKIPLNKLMENSKDKSSNFGEGDNLSKAHNQENSTTNNGKK